ncbi:MAG TPA: hypothetical protein VH373_05600 [Jatrophihabitantaceae bacterium]|jgi:hypothetical protein
MDALLTWPLAGRPARSPWRLVAAAGAITEAISHLPLLMSSLSDTPYIGVGFLLLAVAGFLLALLFVVNDTPAVWVSAAVVATLALIGYILSRTTGLPDFTEYKGDWSYPLGVVSIVGEAMMIAAALLHVAGSARRAGR